MFLTNLFKKRKPVRGEFQGEVVQGFWANLPRPFFVLAPMADVTDCVFREVIASKGKPDVFWTEFVSADGLASERGRKALLIDLKYSEQERPIVAQLFGSDPKNMEFASRLCAELGFDGIDINMGCPDKTILKQKAGAAHILDPETALDVIAAARRGAPHLPISVKTRLGFNRNEFETWIPKLLSANLAALAIHGRTKKDMSKVPARWDDIKKVRDIVRASGKNTLVIGNGDAKDLADAKQKIQTSHVDGVMLGRAIFGNPWLFDEHKKEISVREKLETMLFHTKRFSEVLSPYKNFGIMKKHYKAYVNNFLGAKELREKLMQGNSYEEIEALTLEFLKNPDFKE
jgi:nifR3 family TIM-barrel protein